MRAAKIFSAIIIALQTYHTCAVNEEYYKNEIFPKCCRQGSHYVLRNDRLECADKYTNHIYYQEPLLLKNKSNDLQTNSTCPACAEVLMNRKSAELIKVDCGRKEYKSLNHHFFPKCCPLGHSYDPNEHKCAESPGKFEGYVRFDLSNCRGAIVDYLDFNNYTIDDSLAVTVDVGPHRVFKYGDYCWDNNYYTGGNVLRACVPNSVCKAKGNSDGITCLPKCCPDGHYIIGPCVPTHSHGINMSRLHFEDNFALIPIKHRRKMQSRLKNPKIDTYGILWDGENSYTPDKYCLDHYSTHGLEIFFFHSDETVETVKFNFRKVLVTISCIFFFLTLVSYMLLPEMRENLYGKCVMIYCSIFLFSFSILTYLNFHGNLVYGSPCVVMGFLLVFAFLGTFSWLNIICFDMWMAFGQIRVRTLRSKKSDCKKLIYYNLYGWGIPTLITLIILGMREASWPHYLVPSVGKKECFLENERGNYSHLVYFILPLTLLVASNFILFIKTILYCFQVKDEINRMKDAVPNEKAKRTKSLNADKEKLAMMIKLFVIMGISWLFEILASFISFKDNIVLSYIELIVDCLNCLQGFLIFCILVLKRKVLTSLKNKVFKKIIRRPSDSSTTMTSVYSYARNKDNVNNRNTSETRR